jgi:16S rRNA (uracil1498-N3)-methyltransferase
VTPGPSGPAVLRPSAFVFVDDLEAPVPDEDDQHHLTRVLRLRAGEVVVAADGLGSWRACAVASVAAGSLTLEPTADIVAEAPASPAVTIGFALTKGDRPEWVVQKLTELGVDHIVPVAAERSVVRWSGERAERHHQRLVAVAREAAMQSRRPRLPSVAAVASLAEVAVPFAVCEPGGADRPNLTLPALFVGPEGGWTPQEVARAATAVDLGPTTLRAETATIAAGVLLCALRSATFRVNDVS